MKKYFLVAALLIMSSALVGCDQDTQPQREVAAASSRPNILLIVADDIGYSDVGAFGSEIATPNIDALATEGVRLTQFHVFPNCGPTRGALMTGVDPHRAGLGGNHGAIAENQTGSPAMRVISERMWSRLQNCFVMWVTNLYDWQMAPRTG